ncbi:MAG TPA: histidine kinase dimerization/phosphoacceptor domain-containing protein [Gaiellaceae bacterium]|nr:histidine kinase dimerization/phosphoacceptor domain-containing protein [Gaiellaceae bacterium]
MLAVAVERGRIARELHDVIADGVSVIVVQAQAGPHLIGDPPANDRRLPRDRVERARRARRAPPLLGILRSGDSHAG